MNETERLVNDTSNVSTWFQEEYGGKPIIYAITVYHMWDVIMFGRIAHILWYIIGFVGNIISFRIWILSRMKRYNPSALYLVAITTCDIAYQLLHVFHYLKYFWGLPSLGVDGICQVWNVLNMIPQYASQLLVLGFTTERFISIIRPFQSDRFSRIKRAPIEVGFITVVVVVVSLPQGFLWQVDKQGFCAISRDEQVVLFYEYWSIVTEALFFLIVPMANLVLNYIVLQKTSHALQKNESLRAKSVKNYARQNKPMTKTLMAIAFFRILTQLPMSVTYTLQNFPSLNFGPFPIHLRDMRADAQWRRFLNYYIVRMLIETFAVSHHALSFFIFYISTKQFRDEFHKLVHWFSTLTLVRRSRRRYLVTSDKVTTLSRRTGQSNV